MVFGKGCQKAHKALIGDAQEKAVSNGHIEGPSNKGGDLMKTLGYGGATQV